MSKVADRYAEALFAVAKSENQLLEYVAQAKLVLNSFDEKWLRFFNASKISRTEKKNVLKNGYATSVNRYFLNFMNILIDKNRINLILEIMNKFIGVCNQELNIKLAYVYAPRKITLAQTELIQKGLEEKFQAKIEIIEKIDPSLISGIKVVVENQVIDSSLKTRIDNLKDDLLKEGR